MEALRKLTTSLSTLVDWVGFQHMNLVNTFKPQQQHILNVLTF